MKLLCVGGGSVGHIAPAVAVWDALHEIAPKSEVHFVCSPRPDDAKFLQAKKLPHSILNAPRLSPLLLLKMMQSVKEAKHILKKQKPDIIFSKGGYVSIPVCFAARQMKIPIVLHESDSVSGYANRIVANWAACICSGFPGKHIFTGNPVRKAVTEGSKKEGLRISGLTGDKPILLVMGGSQGAEAINTAITEALDDLLLRCNIIHITGRAKRTKESTTGYFALEFAHDELQHFYACADIALSRAGAGSIAELAANSVPTILVPLRGVGHDHQYKNALVAAKNGGCIRVEQERLSTELIPVIHNLLTDNQKQKEMKEEIQSLSHPDAALQIAKILVQTLEKGTKDQ